MRNCTLLSVPRAVIRVRIIGRHRRRPCCQACQRRHRVSLVYRRCGAQSCATLRSTSRSTSLQHVCATLINDMVHKPQFSFLSHPQILHYRLLFPVSFLLLVRYVPNVAKSSIRDQCNIEDRLTDDQPLFLEEPYLHNGAMDHP